MKKFTALAGTIGTTAAWYILSNKKLRGELAKAKNPEATIKILQKYIGRDAEKIGKEVFDFVRSEEVLEGVSQAKEFTAEKFSEAKRGLGGLLKKGKQLTDEALRKAKNLGQKE